MSDQPPILNEVDTYGPAYMRVAERLGRYEGNEEEAPLAIELLGPLRGRSGASTPAAASAASLPPWPSTESTRSGST